MGLAKGQKKLNTTLIKSVFMFFSGILTGIGGGITGVGAQGVAAPMIEFLLGFTKDRTAGTSIVFALFTAACGTVGAGLSGTHVDATNAVVLAVSATIGAILVIKFSTRPNLSFARRLAQTVAMF